MKRVFLGAVIALAFSLSAMICSPSVAQAYSEGPEFLPEPQNAMGWYLTPKFAASIVMSKEDVAGKAGKSEHDGVVGFTLAAGYDFYRRFDIPIRVELEYGYNDNFDRSYYNTPIDGAIFKSKIGIQTALINAYYDFHYFGNFVPFITAGAGLGFVRGEGSAVVPNETNTGNDSVSGTKTKTEFAFQVGLGASYHFTESIAADLGYRFVKIGTAKYQMSSTNRYDGSYKAKNLGLHQFQLGMRYTF